MRRLPQRGVFGSLRRAPMFELLRTISLRHLLQSPVRSLLVLFGIALGVATVVATFAVNRCISSSFNEMVDRVAGKADLIVTGGDTGVDAALVEAISEVEGVAHVAGGLEIITRRPKGGGPVLVLGVDFLGDKYFLPISVAGGEDVVEDPFSVVNDPSAILLSAALAKTAGVGVGDKFELLTPDGIKSFAVRGVLAEEGLAASFGGAVALMFTEAAQLAFAREEKVDRIDVAVAREDQIAAVETRIAALLQERAHVERPEGRTNHLTSIIQPIRRALYIAGVMALLVGMFLIYNAVGVSVAQRQREIGVLRALGVTRKRVVALFCLEALILAAAGGAVGVGLGYGLAKVALAQTAPTVSRFYAPVRPPPPEITWDLALLGVGVGLVATLIAAYFPARLAAAVDPVEPLRRAVKRLEMRHIPHSRLLILAAAVLVPATVAAQYPTVVTSFGSMFLVLFAGLLSVPAAVLFLRRVFSGPAERVFGLPGRVAIDNAERSLGRSALTVGALMTSVTSSVCVGSWGVSLQASIFEWLDHSLPADIYVTSGSFIADQHNVPFRPEVMEKLEGMPGVRQSYPVRMLAIDAGGKRIQMITVDMVVYEAELARKNMAGRNPTDGPKTIDPYALRAKPSLILGENAARKLGLHAGDYLELETPSGKHKFEVYAIVVDYTSDQGTCLIDRHWYLEFWKDPLIDTIDIFLEPGASLAEVSADIRKRIGGEETLFVVSAADVRDEIRSVIKQSLSIFDSTDLVALIVALLGVIGTMFAAVIDRIREIGVMRAVGATQRQIVSAVVVEAGFLGFAAAVVGLVVGVPMGYVFVRVVGLVGTGWHVDYLFPFEGALRVSMLVISTAAVAGLFPGRRAAKMDVPEALAYE